jgi:hypothetical protein
MAHRGRLRWNPALCLSCSRSTLGATTGRHDGCIMFLLDQLLPHSTMDLTCTALGSLAGGSKFELRWNDRLTETNGI